MNTNKMDPKVLLSTLWIFVMFNYLYCDVFALMDPVLLKQFLTGDMGFVKITEGFLLGAAILNGDSDCHDSSVSNIEV